MSMLLVLQILMSYLCSCYGFVLFVRIIRSEKNWIFRISA